MNEPRPSFSLYPLRFEPIFQYRLWGGRRLEELVSTPLPDGPVGEAWILSDRDDHASVVADGHLKGTTLAKLTQSIHSRIFGSQASKFKRFPLLLKFLDAREDLSVQVHPSDSQTNLLPPGEHGKTEAWVVLESAPGSLIYAGLKPGANAEAIRSLNAQNASETLASFHPSVGDGVFIHSGTVHTLGAGVVVFEVQENSDVTFRIFDWDRVDAKTGQPRELHIERSLESIDWNQGLITPVQPMIESTEPVKRELLFTCEHFTTWRVTGEHFFNVGAVGEPRVVIALDGVASLDSEGKHYPIHKGDVMLLPAEIGVCVCNPNGPFTCLEVAIREV